MPIKTKFEPSVPNGNKIDRPKKTFYLAVSGHAGFPGSLGAYALDAPPADQDLITFVEVVLYVDDVAKAFDEIKPAHGNVYQIVASDNY